MCFDKAKFLSIFDVIHNCDKFSWHKVSVVSDEFYPVFVSTSSNLKVIYFTEDYEGHHLFSAVGYDDKYYFFDYNLKESAVSRTVGTGATTKLFKQVKECL